MQVQAPEDVYLPAVGAFVEAGEWVEVSAAEGKSLADRGWKTKKTAKAADTKDSD